MQEFKKGNCNGKMQSPYSISDSMQLVAATLDSVDLEHSHHPRKFFWTMLVYIVYVS